MPYLEYSLGPGKTQRVSLHKRLTTLGSSEQSDLRLSHPSIAPAHATILHEKGSYRIKTTARSLPLRVSGKRTRDRELSHGDLITIGELELGFSTLAPILDGGGSESRQLAQAMDTQARLLRLSQLLLEETRASSLLTTLMDEVIALCRADKGFLVLADAQDYELCVSRRAGQRELPNTPELLSDKIVQLVLQTQEPQFISNASLDPRFSTSQSVIDLKLSSVMCVPLIAKAKFLGLIYVGSDRPTHPFEPHQLQSLQIFAAQAALLVQTAHRLTDLRDQKAELRQRIDDLRFGSLVGACPQMIANFGRIQKVAPSDVPVWLHGEPGTGKEMFAREIHQRSHRHNAPFVVVNCAVIPAPALRQELFGRQGLDATVGGALSKAANGTLYIAEIEHLPAALQLDLLAAMKDGDRMTTQQGDARILASSTLAPTELLSAKKVREELFFRLRVIDLSLPPLRDRGDDVTLLARYLLERETRDHAGLSPLRFSKSALTAISTFSWPGNIRQLENHIKKAVVLAEGPELSPSDLGLEGAVEAHRSGSAIVPLSQAKEQWQKEYINHALALNHGNRAQTARDLGVDPRTIFRHLERIEKQKQEMLS